MKKRVLLLTTIGVLSAACFVGCGKKATPQTMEELTTAITEKGAVTYHTYTATINLDLSAEAQGESFTFGDTLAMTASMGDAGEMYMDVTNSNLSIGGTGALQLESRIPGFSDIKKILNDANIKAYMPNKSDLYFSSPTVFTDGEAVYHMAIPEESTAEVPALEPMETTSLCDSMLKYGSCDFANVTDYYVVTMPVNDEVVADMMAEKGEDAYKEEVLEIMKQCTMEVKVSAADFSIASFTISGTDIEMNQDGVDMIVSFSASIVPSVDVLTLKTTGAKEIDENSSMTLLNDLNPELMSVITTIMMNAGSYEY